MFRKSPLKSITIGLTVATLISACGIDGQTPLRDNVADRISGPAWLLERQIPVAPFNLTAFERMHERGVPATLYIEGDGKGDRLVDTIFFDPTPTNPVALHLASKDNSTNLAYLARPCQYSGMLEDDSDCESEEWAITMFAPETLNAYNTALNKMKHRYGITTFDIVGYDSGATLAALLAVARPDITSLRTVSGEFDLDVLGPHLSALTHVPQHHFTGGQDNINRPQEIHSYLQALGPNACTEVTFIQEATHERGFVDKWPELLNNAPPQCAEPDFISDFKPMPTPEPIYYPRIGDSKK